MNLRALVCALGTLLALPALACGHCVEDKIASVYDHAVVTQAHKRAHHVAYFALEGNAVRGDQVRSAVQSAAGVDRGSVRVSAATGTLSLSFNPKRAPLTALEEQLQYMLAPQGVSLMMLRVMELPAELKMISRR